MFITITGDLGSGKSTIAKNICENFNFEYFSTGKVQREFAQKRGMTVLEFNKYLSSNAKIDNLIDNMVVEISKENLGKKCIFDSRMAWHFVEKSFKIYLMVRPLEAAKRVMKNDRGEVEKYNSLTEARDNLIERKKIENERFKEIYKVDCSNLNNFNLIIDSSCSTPEEIIDLIMKEAKIWENEEYSNKVYISPKILFPTKDKFKLDKKSVEVKMIGNDYYIINGHELVNLAIQSDKNLIEVKIKDHNNNESQWDEKISKNVLEKWINYTGMKYDNIPNYYK